MAYMGNLKKGDRVKVTIEAEVEYGSSFGVDLKVGGGRVTVSEATWPGVEFEKIEPPVEVFEPGTTVRGRLTGGLFTVISKNSCFSHQTLTTYENVTRPFTSENYERATIG